MKPRVIGRVEAAKMLGMSPGALSNHVYRGNFHTIPRPFVVGGQYRWTDKQILEWIDRQVRESTAGTITTSSVPKRKRKGGRPKKKRSAAPC